MHFASCWIVVLLAWSPAAQQSQAASVSLTVETRRFDQSERSARGAKSVDTRRARTVELQPTAAVELESPLSPGFRGALRTQGRSIRVAIGWDGSAPRARFGLDADADGSIGDGEVAEVAVRASKVAKDGEVPRVQFDVPVAVTVGGRRYGLQIRRYEDSVVRAEFMVDVDYCVGEAELDGVAHTLLVVDWDDDGRFGTDGDFYTFLPSEQYARQPSFGAEHGFTFPLSDQVLLGGRRARLADVVAADGTTRVDIVDASEPVALYLQRRRARAVARCARALADRAAEFEAENGVARRDDVSQPRIAWLWVLDAGAALAAAREAGKPLFLLFENEPDERCAQMDLYTWDAPEVVEAASAFVCARVTQELDLERSGAAFDVRLGPAYVFCDSKGRPLHYRDRKTGRAIAMTKGFKTPKDMAALLRASAERIAGGEFDPK
ncbi:MAG: thioredoxin family protein [Planctomycetota bacterium]